MSRPVPADPHDPLLAFARLHATADPAEAMLSACRDLLARTDQVRPPIGLRALLADFNASVTRCSTSVDALLRRREGRWVIETSPGDERTWRRQRFTLGHEVGHLILLRALEDRPAELARLQDRDVLPRVERLCNIAARELLLPAGAVRQAMERHGVHEEGLVALYDLFRVSWTALLIRVGEVLDGSTVALWRRWARPGRNEREALRVVSVARGTGAPWLPAGLTTRYLTGTLVEDAFAGLHGRGTVGVDFGGVAGRWRGVAVGLQHLPPRVVTLGSSSHVLERRAPRPDVDVVLTLMPPAGVATGAADRVWRASGAVSEPSLPLDALTRPIQPALW